MKTRQKTKKAAKPKPHAPKPQCFRCDGTGSLCNVCGQFERACQCEDGPQMFDCPNCNGKGT